MQAVEADDVADVDRLLELGADPDAVVADVGFGQITPLMKATLLGHGAVATALIQSGANPDLSVEVMEPWYQCPVGAKTVRRTPLTAAVERNDLGMIRGLLVVGAKPNAVDGSGQMPLHLAAAAGRTGLVRTLLAGGALPNAHDRSGKTALDHAKSKGSTDMSLLLQQATGQRESEAM